MEFPLYIGSKKESMPKKLHEVNMHAQDFQGPKPNEKEIPSENRIPNGEIITWKISLKIHQGMRYPLIHTKLKMSNSQREDGSKHTKLSTKFHDGTKYQKVNGLPSTNTHLIRIIRRVF